MKHRLVFISLLLLALFLALAPTAAFNRNATRLGSTGSGASGWNPPPRCCETGAPPVSFS
jgi:hypothetical protein